MSGWTDESFEAFVEGFAMPWARRRALEHEAATQGLSVEEYLDALTAAQAPDVIPEDWEDD